jgi:hypothetical protein
MLGELPVGKRKAIEAVIVDICKNLIGAWDEMNAGVNTDNGQSSFSPTLEIKPGKKNRWHATIKYRVRTPREMTEFEMHLDDSDQLSFGAPAGGWGDDDAGGGEATE